MTDFVEFLSSSGSGDLEDNSTVTCTASSLQTANGMALPVSLCITCKGNQDSLWLAHTSSWEFFFNCLIMFLIVFKKLKLFLALPILICAISF